ncbi:hypothetical protein FRC01_004189 [Tulasnella sp. 417]|nr:hypothetical protein FRC01_004189 [Tulasnella sp. 417]
MSDSDAWRPSHSHSSSLGSNSDETVRRGASESPLTETVPPLVHNARPTFPDLVQQVMKANAPAPEFRADYRLQEETHWWDLERGIRSLEDRIHECTRAVRPLGSSSGLIFSAIGVRRHMTEIQDVFFANAAAIYVAFGEKPESELHPKLRSYSPAKSGRQAGDMKDFPDYLTGFASELRQFLNSLYDIPEFSDKALTDSIEGFAAWLDYRANGLQDFGDTLSTSALKRYTNGLMLEMGKYLKQMGDALHNFSKDGVTAIRIAQDRSKEQLLNMSTVATFFSGVASTTFQYTSGNKASTLDEVVRALWVSSLILSIASAINSQLAMHWRTAMYRSPRSALPTLTSAPWNAPTVSMDSENDKTDFQRNWQIASLEGEVKTGMQDSPASSTQAAVPFSPFLNQNFPEAQRFHRAAWLLARDAKARDLLSLMPMGPEVAKTLKSLKQAGHYLPPEGKGPVHDLSFAPDGKWIAASFRDGTVGLWRVESGLTWDSHLAAQQGEIVWDHKSTRLLIPQKDGVEIWEQGVCTAAIVRNYLPTADLFPSPVTEENTGEESVGGVYMASRWPWLRCCQE